MRKGKYAILIALVLAILTVVVVPGISDEAVSPGVTAPAPAETTAPTAQPAPSAEEVAPAAPATTETTPAAPTVETAPLVVTPAPPAVPETAPKLEVPAVKPDTNLFKRTPIIDGNIEEGEWDTFYATQLDGADATVYVDWDSSSLYIGAKSAKPFDLVATIDANDDGWFHGNDNYEFKTTQNGGSTTLAVSRYESQHSRTASAVPVTGSEAAMVVMKSVKADGCYVIEMSIPPALIRGFRLEPNKKLGLEVALKAEGSANWVPTESTGDTGECVLVTKKIVSLKPLNLGFDLKDSKIARGEELVGKFHITNTSTESVDLSSFIVAGEGKAGDYLSSGKVRLQGLVNGKHISHDVRSIIPLDMPLGSWAIGAEVKSGSGRMGGALVSFDVVEPYEISLKLPEKPVRADVKDVTFGIIINNNMSHSIRGTAKITLPSGWELWKDKGERDFSTPSGDSLTSVAFRAKPPLGATGDVPVSVEVTVDGKTKKAEGTFEVINPPTK